MTDANELEALKARLQELEAKQAPTPVGGFMGALSLVGHVVGLVPRWLLVAAGVVVVAWLGFDLYVNPQIKVAEKNKATAEAQAAKDEVVNTNEEAQALRKTQGSRPIPTGPKW